MKNNIKLGYEVGTGEEVKIRNSHLICTGITQLSGKTTTLETLIKRSGLKAIVFKTKIGEKGFSEGIEIPPFFKDRSDCFQCRLRKVKSVGPRLCKTCWARWRYSSDTVYREKEKKRLREYAAKKRIES